MGFRYHAKPIRQTGIEVKDVCAASATRSLLDGVKHVYGALILNAALVFAQEARSFHLDVKAFGKTCYYADTVLLKIGHLLSVVQVCFLKKLQRSVKLFTRVTVYTPVLALSVFQQGVCISCFLLRCKNSKPGYWVHMWCCKRHLSKNWINKTAAAYL